MVRYPLRRISSALILVAAGCCCDEDCRYVYECYFDGCCQYCAWVLYCNYYGVGTGPTEEGDIDFVATVEDAGEGKIDILVEVFGDSADGERPVSVRLVGPGVAPVLRQSERTLWAFHGIPVRAVEAIVAGLPGTSIRVEKPIDVATAGSASPCDPREALLEASILPAVDATRRLGNSVSVTAPEPAGILTAGTYVAIAIEIIRPWPGEPEAQILRPGESATVRLDRAGEWSLRASLLLDDACGPGSADAIVLGEQRLTVR